MLDSLKNSIFQKYSYFLVLIKSISRLFWTTSIQQRNKTKQARPSSLLLLSIGAAFFAFASKTSIVSINYAEVNSSNLSGLEHSFLPSTRSNRRGGEERFPREERRAAPSSHLLDRFGDVWRGYLRKSSPFTSFLLTFGKLTTKFELLSQFRKAESRRPFRGCLRESSPFTSFLLTFGKLTTKFELLLQFREAEIRRPSAAAYGKAVPSRFPHLRSESWP